MYYLGEFSLKTNKNDSIVELNDFLIKLGSRQRIMRRKYKRSYKYMLTHNSTSGLFIDQIFDLGETIHCKPKNSILKG